MSDFAFGRWTNLGVKKIKSTLAGKTSGSESDFVNLASQLNKSPDAVRHQARRLGVHQPTRSLWDDDKKAKLQELKAKNMSMAQIAKEMQITRSAVAGALARSKPEDQEDD